MSEFIQLTCATVNNRVIYLKKSAITSFVKIVRIQDNKYLDKDETLVYCGQAEYYVRESPGYIKDALE